MKYTPKYLLPAVIALSCALATPVYAADADNDGVDDAIDNCLGKSNNDQRDTDGDGFGNRCDGDLNNDGKTNSLDLGLFKKKLGSTNPDADFNGDGIVNAADTSMLQQLSQKVPGPTAIKTDPELADNPPEVDAMDTAELDSPLPDGRNAAFFVKFKTTPDKRAIVILENDKPVALNDIGVSPDQVAEDGVFSGYSSVDFADLQQKETRLAEQIAKIPNPTITNFSGRSVIGKEFYKPAGMKSVFLDTSIPVGLNPVVLPNLDAPILPLTFDPYKVLAITDPAVIADPNLTGFHCGSLTTGNINGPWSFKTLMSNMTGSTNPAVHKSFITNWLRKWMSPDTVNGYTIDPRSKIGLFFSELEDSPTALVDIDKLPFRLLAIMNRMDVGTGSPYRIRTPNTQQTNQKEPTETRFVFGLLEPGTCQTKEMTVILEYSDPPSDCQAQKTRAAQWIALGGINDPSAYKNALLAITNTVTLPNVATSSWPNHGYNGSAINQVRTNELAFGAPFDRNGYNNNPTNVPWELREFRLSAPNSGESFSNLAHNTIRNTPQKMAGMLPSSTNWNITPKLTAYINQNVHAILFGTDKIPANFQANPFLGASVQYTLTPIDGDSAWQPWQPDGYITVNPPLPPPSYVMCNLPQPDCIQSEVRHKFALNTCDGCHSIETGTEFTHLSNPAYLPVQLSSFLTGTDSEVNDSVNLTNVIRKFNDLQRRGQVLQSISNQSCTGRSLGSFATHQAALKVYH